MNALPENHFPAASEANIKSILEWLALAHGRHESEDPEQLYRQLVLLRETPLPTPQRIKLLDLLYQQAESIVAAEYPTLHEVSLPISRKLRHRVRLILKLLETLTQDYFNTLSELFDPQSSTAPRNPQTTLRRVTYCIAWQIQIDHLLASPTSMGLWLQLHSALHTSRRLGVAETPGPRNGRSIQHIYTSTLLAAIAQPASFSSNELDLIHQYIEHSGITLSLSETAPVSSHSTFWIDLQRDVPAHALVRRAPAADTHILFFSCDAIAKKTQEDLEFLTQGGTAASLGLPPLADTRTGRGVLRRLITLWGQPAKRKFPRRRQSYRTLLCAGFNKLWHLLHTPNADTDLSEWMVINESPDGYSLMHVAGKTHRLRVGDIVALQLIDEYAETKPLWHICIVRWALSENPEHIELGLQLLATNAIAAKIAQPSDAGSGSTFALILPEAPPLHHSQSLIVQTGTLKNEHRKIIVLVENGNLEIREIQTTRLDEQTSRVEIFSVAPDVTA